METGIFRLGTGGVRYPGGLIGEGEQDRSAWDQGVCGVWI